MPVKEITPALGDRFRIDKQIGSGGWAVVYVGDDLELGRRVAIKVLRPEHASEAGQLRFGREIELAANLRHPHLLPLLDSGFENGFSYYVMPLVEGESLRERLARQGQLSIDEAVTVASQVADALAYAHGQGIIHRDIKPGNILLDSGHAVLADFGIATVTERLSLESLTSTGVVPGTPHYMAPEQLDLETEIDARADIYALGCVLYEMLAGEPPVSGTRASVVLARKMAGEIPRLRVARETVPEALEHIVHTALARIPADRYQTAAAFLQTLERFAETGEGGVGGAIPTGRPSRSAGERIAQGAGWILGTVAVTASIGFLTTTAFDIKLQMPAGFRPSSSDHLLIGARALLPVAVFGLLAVGAFMVARFVGRRVGEIASRFSAFAPATDAFDRLVVTKSNRAVRAARATTLADAFFFSLVAVSVLVLVRFSDLLTVLWSSETAILACEHKGVHRSFLLTMVATIVGFGSVWTRLFPWLERRDPHRSRIAAVRWGSLAWLVALLITVTLPWRIIFDDGERVRLDGRPAYLLEELDSGFLVVEPERGFARVVEKDGAPRFERIRVRGHLFEGETAFESGLPLCEAVTFADPPGQRSTP